MKFYVPVYAFTLLLSATLLFSVQPLFSKMILPLLGGTPQVWNTAMLFFQVMLLAGYAYAHTTTKFLGLKTQAILHITLLILFTVVLPIAIPDGWLPPTDQDPTLWQLSLMTISLGGPFFVLAGSAPMFQQWFRYTSHPDADNPYFLYGASNLGSMTSLLAYPVVIEPLLDLTQQSQIWTYGYFALIGATIFAFSLVWNRKKPVLTKQRQASNDHSIVWPQRLKWLILAFIPSSLMLGITTYITTDIASVPLLWILPLALYLSTFIIVFARQPIIDEKHILLIHAVLLVGLVGSMLTINVLHAFLLIGLHMSLFFFSALVCHTELAKSRPSATHLTEFYLIMSIGGALGGFFNAIIAPNIFVIPFEYALALCAACFMRYGQQKLKFELKFSPHLIVFVATLAMATACFFVQNAALGVFLTFCLILCVSFLIDKRFLFASAVGFCLLLNPPGHHWSKGYYEEVIHQERNFFGVVKVIATNNGQRLLLHGTTNHGTQLQAEEYRLIPLSYYGLDSPYNDLFTIYNGKSGKQHIGVLGLGIGVLACYTNEGRSFDFFEIDPSIVDIAENPEYFTFLSDCGSSYENIKGDGRLTVQEKPEEYYDILAIDAFSSDNIPVHLLTLEAIKIYLEKLKDDGILALHISNNYLDLEPVLAKAAEELNVPALAKISVGKEIEGTKASTFPSHLFVMTKNKKHIKTLQQKDWSKPIHRKGVNLWTDKYSNIVSVLGNKSGKIRQIKIGKAKKAKERENSNNSGE